MGLFGGSQIGGSRPRVARIRVRSARSEHRGISCHASPGRAAAATGNGAPACAPCACGQRLAQRHARNGLEHARDCECAHRKGGRCHAGVAGGACRDAGPRPQLRYRPACVRDFRRATSRPGAGDAGPHQSATARLRFSELCVAQLSGLSDGAPAAVKRRGSRGGRAGDDPKGRRSRRFG